MTRQNMSPDPRYSGALRPLALALGLILAALPALAQIVVVPLDPVDPTEVAPGDGTILNPLPDGTVPDLLNPENGTTPDLLNPEDGIVLDDGTVLGPIETPPPPGSMVGDDVMTVEEDKVATGTGAVLRGLDKLAGSVSELTLANGETGAVGWLQVTLGECRYPVDNPSGDAYAWIVIREKSGEAPIFEGWMIASSPALDALDHARFDVWVVNCTTN